MSWTLIEHQALTSSAASVTLGSGGTIPQTYKTLVLLTSTRTSTATASGGFLIAFNGSTANRSTRGLYGTGSGVLSYSGTFPLGGMNVTSSMTASTFSNNALTIPNYSGSTNKPSSLDAVQENNATGASQFMNANLWSDTAAITSIVCTPEGGDNFVSGSTFTLYGLA